MNELAQRQRVRYEARLWTGTPYHHRAAVLGSGVDCARLLLEVFAGAGLIERFTPDKYSHDWHLHRDEEKYLHTIERYAVRSDDSLASINDRAEDFTVQTGNILMWRLGRTYSHSAVVTDWPYIIHAYYPSMIVEEVDVRGTPMAERPMRVYSYWGKR